MRGRFFLTLILVLTLAGASGCIVGFASIRGSGEVVTHEEDGFSFGFEAPHTIETSMLEDQIPHRQCLVYQEDVRVDVNGHRTRESHEHPGGIGLDRPIDKIADLREFQDFA